MNKFLASSSTTSKPRRDAITCHESLSLPRQPMPCQRVLWPIAAPGHWCARRRLAAGCWLDSRKPDASRLPALAQRHFFYDDERRAMRARDHVKHVEVDRVDVNLEKEEVSRHRVLVELCGNRERVRILANEMRACALLVAKEEATSRVVEHPVVVGQVAGRALERNDAQVEGRGRFEEDVPRIIAR
eukprot:1052022-Prymnesium_polylepis.1